VDNYTKSSIEFIAMRLLLVVFFVTLLPACGGGAEAQLPTPGPTPPPGSQAFGPPWLTAQTADGVGWTGCVDYEAGRDGSGCFIQFLSNNRANTRISGVTLNGGCWDCTPGKEQGDLDVAVLVDGQSGHIYAFTNVGIGVSHTDWAAIGQSSGRFKEIWLTSVPCPPSVPGTPSGCVRVNGGFVPVYP
jgi:hypothetical protein